MQAVQDPDLLIEFRDTGSQSSHRVRRIWYAVSFNEGGHLPVLLRPQLWCSIDSNQHQEGNRTEPHYTHCKLSNCKRLGPNLPGGGCPQRNAGYSIVYSPDRVNRQCVCQDFSSAELNAQVGLGELDFIAERREAGAVEDACGGVPDLF